MSRELCDKCEKLLQLYVDGELNEAEALDAEAHLERCGYCLRRFRFERQFRTRLRQLRAEPVSAELMVKLASLRAPLE